MDFFPALPKGPIDNRVPQKIINQIVELRKQGLSIYDIDQALPDEVGRISVRTISRVLSQAGFDKLKRRTEHERGVTRKNTFLSDRARGLDFDTLEPLMSFTGINRH